jgi:hypothetical protein
LVLRLSVVVSIVVEVVGFVVGMGATTTGVGGGKYSLNVQKRLPLFMCTITLKWQIQPAALQDWINHQLDSLLIPGRRPLRRRPIVKHVRVGKAAAVIALLRAGAQVGKSWKLGPNKDAMV